MLGLQELKLQQTVLRGALPPELGALPYLMEVDIRNTLMTCCTTEGDAQSAAKNGSGLLPGYLAFDANIMESPMLVANEGLGAAQRLLEGGEGDDFGDPGDNMQ